MQQSAAPMERLSEQGGGNVVFTDLHPAPGDSRSEILRGLMASQKTINPKYFYDERGSRLFETITRLPEYYPTRTEAAILRRHAGEIAAVCADDCVLIEPGSGNCEKVRYLLRELNPAVYVPMDISADFLRRAACELGAEYPQLAIHAVCADFNDGWEAMPPLPAGRRVIFYPGSTIGNLEPDQARAFLSRVRSWMGAGGGALIGVDLHKSADILHPAYNDAQGVTADFNLNILHHVNRLADADFDPARFEHRAFYDDERQRIEMHLVSKVAQSVQCNGAAVNFARGETIRTEYSHKYTVAGFAALARGVGLQISRSWLDEAQLFSVNYLEPSPAG
jgi:dimethylhistidine N-methyltransferase